MKAFSAEPVTVPRSAPAAAPDPAPPATLHRALAVLAAAALFTGMRRIWAADIIHHPPFAAALMAGYGLVLAAAVLALTARTARGMLIAEVALLAVGITRTVAFIAATTGHAPYTSDEGALVQQAAAALWHGGDIYRTSYDLAHVPEVTKLMGGGVVTTFGYPPLSVLLAAPLTRAVPGLPSAALVSTAGLVAAALALFALLPRTWRSAATLVCFGIGADLLMPSARQGYPTLVALPFLVPAVAHWSRTGRGGRLGRRGTARALCLGLAAAAQQLAWFLVPFLLVGIHRARRAELPPREAALVTARYAALAAAAFLAVDLPFLLRDPGAWLTGIAAPILQHAVPHGQGLVDLSSYFGDGSGALQSYSSAALLLLVTLLTALAFFPRRLGPAAVVLPWLAFYLSTRSQDGYYTLLVPLWLLSALTVRSDDFAPSRPPARPGPAGWLPGWLRARLRARLPVRSGLAGRLSAARWGGRAVAGPLAVGVLAVCTAACLATAVLTPPPLRMAVTAVVAGKRPGTVEQLAVLVANDSGRPVSPHFALTTSGPGMTTYWRVDLGPPSLGPHGAALYLLSSARGPYRRGPGGTARLSAVTDDPMTISTIRVPRHA